MQSRIYLPKLEPAPNTILEYLIAHFPQVSSESWHQRIEQGRVTADNGSTLTVDSAYRHGLTVFYQRENLEEPAAEEEAAILYRDAEILVADKPHGMVVTPAGEYVERSLLFRLQQSTGLTSLTPMHRLDRDTAGAVLFSIHPESRGRYHQLFSAATIEREYLAVARVDSTADAKEWLVRNKIEEGTPWYRQRIADDPAGTANAITQIKLLEFRNGFGLFELRPQTGKKHQLRLHMASLGFPIVGDDLYPELQERQKHNPPLQLLAHRLSFVDPLSGEPRCFTSERKLRWPLLRPVE